MAPDIAAMAEAARTDGARLFYLANPDNPTGALHGPDAVREILARLPADCLLALDEAYIDCAPPGAALPLDCSRPGVIRFRTFSKAYGLAGIRVGYAIGHPTLIGAFDRIRNHFGMGRIAQAGALAALEDIGHHDGAVAWIAAARERITVIASKAGLNPLPSAGNFVAIDCAPAGVNAAALLDALGARDVFVRRGMAAPLDRLIRVSCGHRDDLDRFEAALPEALAEVTGG